MRSLVPLVGGLVGVLACKPPASSPHTTAPPSQMTPVEAHVPATPDTEARQIYDTRCSVCHGATGTGDGPGAAAITPRPRSFRDPAWQASVTDEQIEQIVLRGGAAVGKSSAMPPNPDLADKPAVLAALRAHLRAMR